VNLVFILRPLIFKPSLLCTIYNIICPEVVFRLLEISKSSCETEISSTLSGYEHEVIRVVPIACDVVFWKCRHRPSLRHHESARVKNSPWNQNLIVSYVKEPQNKAGRQSFAVAFFACQGDQDDDTGNNELRSIRSRRAKRATNKKLSCIKNKVKKYKKSVVNDQKTICYF